MAKEKCDHHYVVDRTWKWSQLTSWGNREWYKAAVLVCTKCGKSKVDDMYKFLGSESPARR